MSPGAILFFAAALTLSACARVPQSGADGSPDAGTLMSRAESLSAAGSYAEAAAGFASVSALHPASRHAKEAAWNAALLYSSPANPEPDDSTAIHWLKAFMTYRLDATEQRSAEACLFLLQRITALKAELALKSSDVASRAQRLKDLETQLRQATDELQKMKEIDVKLHQRQGKK